MSTGFTITVTAIASVVALLLGGYVALIWTAGYIYAGGWLEAPSQNYLTLAGIAFFGTAWAWLALHRRRTAQVLFAVLALLTLTGIVGALGGRQTLVIKSELSDLLIAITLVAFMISLVILGSVRSNSALMTDTYASSLRAQHGAAKRER